MTTTSKPSPSAIPESPLGKLGFVKSGWFWGLFALLVIGTALWFSIPKPPELPVIATVPEWSLTRETGKPFGSTDLKGKVYLANFVFSRCPSVCPKMLKDTVVLQKNLAGYGNKVAITTFTVDPEFDQPSVLNQVSKQYEANPAIWSFLTSNDKDALMKLYSEGFKIGISQERPVGDLFDIAHSERIVLVDQNGQIRGFYSYTPESSAQLMVDVGRLVMQ